MKILILSSLYPPKMLGGAEDCARNFAQWAARQGNDVQVVRAADSDEDEGSELDEAGVRIHRLRTPHIYAPFRFPTAPGWQKPIWHLQDHFDTSITRKLGKILDDFAPDVINIHLLQGLGYRALKAIGQRQIPVTFVLHDLGLACIRMAMFKGGQDCAGQCRECSCSSRYKLGMLQEIPRVSFISPSRSNLDTLARFFPMENFASTVILNPNAYPQPTAEHTPSGTLRLLYAGRLQENKGVSQLLEAVEAVARTRDVSLSLAGSGPEGERLRARYENAPWCTFLGFVSQQELANAMAVSDLLCIPSIWAENSPGVVVQALAQGLPVLGSARGGIPELVRDGHNGRLVHDQGAQHWAAAIDRVASGEEPLAQWRANAAAAASEFSQGALGQKVLDWMRETCAA